MYLDLLLASCPPLLLLHAWISYHIIFLTMDVWNGGLAQLVERVLSMHEVVDSISTFSIFSIIIFSLSKGTLIGSD